MVIPGDCCCFCWCMPSSFGVVCLISSGALDVLSWGRFPLVGWCSWSVRSSWWWWWTTRFSLVFLSLWRRYYVDIVGLEVAVIVSGDFEGWGRGFWDILIGRWNLSYSFWSVVDWCCSQLLVVLEVGERWCRLQCSVAKIFILDAIVGRFEA